MVRGPAQRLCSGWLETCVHCKLRLEHEALLYVCVFSFFLLAILFLVGSIQVFSPIALQQSVTNWIRFLQVT